MSFFRGLWKSNSKHKKLCEEWALANSCESVGPSTSSSSSVGAASSSSASASSSRTGPADDTESAPETIFSLKYLGSTPVESPSSEMETAEAIKSIISMAKTSGKKLQRVSLAVSLRGIRMTDLSTEEEQLRVSIYRISYCSADARHDHVFAFIATNLNETNECHAYLCPKRKVAQTVTLTVAQAFNTAYELWQLSQIDSQICHAQDRPKLPAASTSEPTDKDEENENDKSKAGDKKIDKKGTREENASSDAGSQKSGLIGKETRLPRVTAKIESWVSFDEEPQRTLRSGSSRPDEGIPLKALKSPSSASITSCSLSASASPSNTVAPQQQKLQNAWLDEPSASTAARHTPVDLVCSS